MSKNASNIAVMEQPRKTSKQKNSPNEQAIAARAHEIFRERGETEGHDLDDWLQAERELSNGNK